MNITTDNYEAYLIDYLDGNLSADEMEQLKQFVSARGLNWDELTEDLPHLEVPQIVYENKNSLSRPFDPSTSSGTCGLRGLRSLSLSKRRLEHNTIPLYVKIVSAAAAAGLLLTVTLWPEKSLPKVEPIAELKPILPGRLITADEVTPVLPQKTAYFIQPPQTVTKEKPVVPERVDMSLLAKLELKKVQTLPASQHFEDPNSELLACRLSADLAFAQRRGSDIDDYWNYEEDYEHHSLLSRGILWLTKGHHDSFASLFGAGMRKAKQSITDAATDMALTAYSRVDEYIEDVKEQREGKRGE